MKIVTLQVTAVANGGAAIGRDAQGQTLFVPYAIPGETVEVTLGEAKQHYTPARLRRVVQPSPDRVEPVCPHFGVCGGCHFQHIAYPAQLRIKQAIVQDQLQRIGNLKQALVRPTVPNATPYGYRVDLSLSPTADGQFGLWSPVQQQVIPINTCPIAHPALQDLLLDVDLALPDLRKLTLRVGDDGALLAALEVEDVEPPELEADFPISVAILLPDKMSASLIGDNYVVQAVKGRDFRVSPGCFFYPSPLAAGSLVDVVCRYAALTGREQVLELYSGVGVLTAFLAGQAGQITAVEVNEDAVADTAVNLADTDNVCLYQDWVEDVLPTLTDTPDLAIVHPPDKGVSPEALTGLVNLTPRRLIYVSSDVATLARDSKQLVRAGYRLVEVQPIDMTPQAYQVDTVSLWQGGG